MFAIRVVDWKASGLSMFLKLLQQMYIKLTLLVVQLNLQVSKLPMFYMRHSMNERARAGGVRRGKRSGNKKCLMANSSSNKNGNIEGALENHSRKIKR